MTIMAIKNLRANVIKMMIQIIINIVQIRNRKIRKRKIIKIEELVILAVILLLLLKMESKPQNLHANAVIHS